MKLISTRMFAGAILAAAVAATPIYTLAQDPPEPPEQPEPREDAERQEAQRDAQRAQREAQQAERAAQRELERAARPAQPAPRAAEEEAQRAREGARARIAPVPGVQGEGPRVFQMRPAVVETKPQTYLGISTRQLTPDVAAHVGEAPEGVGLIVTYLDEEGPAAKAGVKEHDVLVKIETPREQLVLVDAPVQ